MDYILRRMEPEDYDQAIALWQATPGIALSGADNQLAFNAFLARNIGLNHVAAKDGAVIGTVLCGHDGRRGYIYHLAVKPEMRGRGIASQLIQVVLAGLRKQGIQKCHLFVIADNEAGKMFWQKTGWKLRQDIQVFSKDIEAV